MCNIQAGSARCKLFVHQDTLWLGLDVLLRNRSHDREVDAWHIECQFFDWFALGFVNGIFKELTIEIEAHGGDLAWHPWSRRWLLLFTQKGGVSSYLGEIWLASAPSPTGPWTDARKVATHDHYTFYNPILHAEAFRDDSPLIHFEGTYVTTFSGHREPRTNARADATARRASVGMSGTGEAKTGSRGNSAASGSRGGWSRLWPANWFGD